MWQSICSECAMFVLSAWSQTFPRKKGCGKRGGGFVYPYFPRYVLKVVCFSPCWWRQWFAYEGTLTNTFTWLTAQRDILLRLLVPNCNSLKIFFLIRACGYTTQSMPNVSAEVQFLTWRAGTDIGWGGELSMSCLENLCCCHKGKQQLVILLPWQ